MISTNNLEIKGILREHPLAELLVEIAQARLNGSLRLGRESQKTVVYFDAGEVVFAVSNARALRLFEMLLGDGKITREQLVQIADFTNDFLLGQNLLKNNLFSKPEIDRLFTEQVETILKDAFGWQDGEWTFSPLVRIKGDIRFVVKPNRLAMEYARSLSGEAIAARFTNSREFFGVKPAMPVQINLSPPESFVFSRFENSGLSVQTIKNLSGLPDSETLKILYTLWLGGFLVRQNANSAFSERQTSDILSANFSLIQGQKPLAFVDSAALEREPPKTVKAEQPIEKPAPIAEQISLERYLAQVENADNYYEILAVEPQAAAPEIKLAYFSLAKRFHPDLFHKEADTKIQQRVQQAFSQLAQAYDTLRHEKNREVYNFKMRKALELKDKRPKANAGGEGEKNNDSQKQLEQASDNFEQGFNLLMNEEFDAAIPYLARAVHLANDNARFHAYYGKALASDNKHRHKAEAELQTAIKLDERNADFRIMLAEFFVQVNLLKRAEGELTRLLAIVPDSREANILLDSLRKK